MQPMPCPTNYSCCVGDQIPVIQWNLSNTDTLGPIKCVLIREVSSFQGANNTYLHKVGTWSSVLIREVSTVHSQSSKLEYYSVRH